MVRPSFILGGKGTGIAEDAAQFAQLAAEGLAASPVGQILVEQSIAGWKEFELEVMRDAADNCVVVCSIENFDPMGVHTGDSITVAPAQTLTDVEYQAMRDDAFACLRRVGVETGGSNVQFAVDPATGRRVIIEMNPRVSRSSALASKATGFPIAKIAARLAVGYLLDEIPNDITQATPASFEPTIDYVVTKIPRWAFEKLPGADGRLGTRMQSVGEVMAIGRTFCESLQKALRSLEQGRPGSTPTRPRWRWTSAPSRSCSSASASPRPSASSSSRRRCAAASASPRWSRRTGIDPWFVAPAERISAERPPHRPRRRARRGRLPPGQAAGVLRRPARLPARVDRGRRCAAHRLALGVRATFKTVDTCAAEFEAFTPYHYATYEEEDEVRPSGRDRVDHPRVGSQPDRPGDRVRLLLRARLHVAARRRLRDGDGQLQPRDGLDRLRHLGPPLLRAADRRGRGQRARRRAGGRRARWSASSCRSAGRRRSSWPARSRPSWCSGTSPASIDLAEDRERWNALCHELGIPQPPGGTATTHGRGAGDRRDRSAIPVLLRPSYVLGGRAMEIVYDDDGRAPRHAVA